MGVVGWEAELGETGETLWVEIIEQHKGRRNNSNNSNTKEIIYKTSDVQCNCLPPGTPSLDSHQPFQTVHPFPSHLPPYMLSTVSEWYQIPPWLVRFGCRGCACSQLLVKSNPIWAKPRTKGELVTRRMNFSHYINYMQADGFLQST